MKNKTQSWTDPFQIENSTHSVPKKSWLYQNAFFPLNQQISTKCFAFDELAFFWHENEQSKKKNNSKQLCGKS